jgi:alpha-glucosidase (family GH31 glycosyl hydrolase)
MEFRNGNAHGVFMLNSNAMDVVMQPGLLEFRMVGGIIDMFVFVGSSPEEVVQQYQEVVGRPFLIPDWSLGFHQCRWGYSSLDEVKQVVANYSWHGIPLTTMWTDIDYMAPPYEIMQFDPQRFPLTEVQEFVQKLNAQGMHYVVIVDVGVAANESFSSYQQGLKDDVFIMNPYTQSPAQNDVWPGPSVFTDYSLQRGAEYWSGLVTDFVDSTGVSGIWLDMNEPACFLVNTECQNASTSNLPYLPGGLSLDHKTLGMCMEANVSSMFNYHSLYGFHESMVTSRALQSRGTRPFVISRSSFPGHGRYAGHWTGDNDSTFASLAASIPGILNFNLFGIPMVGSDIGGFNGESNPELFARWIELGSFYMCSRDHNSINMSPQEPYAFNDQVTDISRKMLLNRMSLFPYFYTLMFNAHLYGGTVTKPLFFEFPGDTSDTLPYLDRQFLIGRGLMVSPVLDAGAVSVEAYFPGDVWYDYWTGNLTHSGGSGLWKTLSAPLDTINVHIRGGTIIPRQVPGLTIAQTRSNPYELLVALDSYGGAKGLLVVDDGESLSTVAAQEYAQVSYQATSTQGKSGVLRTKNEMNGYPPFAEARLKTIRIMGTGCSAIDSAFINGVSVESQATLDDYGVLVVASQSVPMDMSIAFVYNCH